ncbi:hypothetical protein HU913_004855 [Salmonella enterica]|nr:hypothetical protein [Salmonella enterica]
MSYSVINQDGVHLCDIPLNVYQVIRRQSLSALWLYWAQSLNLVKVLIACVGKMIFVMPVMWFWVLVVCRLVEPERISDVSGLISPDVIGWAAGAAITLIIFSGHCCKVSDEAAFCLIQRPYISKTLLTRRISPRGSP